MALTITRGAPGAELVAVQALIARVEDRDGAPPLSDQALTHLTSPSVEHLLAHDAGTLVGYGQLDGPQLEVAAEPAAVDPVLEAAEADSPGGHVIVWAHGRHSVVSSPARGRGYRPIRTLWQLRRPVGVEVPTPALPEGVAIRSFRPGQDEAAWVRVNAAAFAHHAEQGGWTEADIAAREAEPWFDPDGFLLAERDGELVGFHWTKVHPDGTGEVYVLGIAPEAQGIGLGPALLSYGLRHLGDREILLYVDDDNPGAKHLYERYGFVEFDSDVQFERHRN